MKKHHRKNRWLALCAAFPLAGLAQPPLGYTITSVAGDGTANFGGDSGPAKSAQFNNPYGIAFDASGNLFIADQYNSRVRKLGTDGNVTTVGGNGTKGDSGDTGQATSANISYPTNIAVDASGNIYFADTGNHTIRKISGTTITTFAGTGQPGFGGDGGPANKANLNSPVGVAVDAAGKVYIADTGNNRVRVVGTDGNINNFAGTSNITALGDGGAALNASLNAPAGLFVDAGGNVFIADTGNHRIRKVTTDGLIATAAGTSAGFSGDGGPALAARLNYPKNVAVDAQGVMYIADAFNGRIRAVSKNGTITTIAGNSYLGFSGDGVPATDAILRFPSALALASNGEIYVADTQNSLIRKLTPLQAGKPAGPPSITTGAINSASAFGAFSSAAPGSWIEIFGANLSATTRSWTAQEFNGNKAPSSLDGTSVTVGGQPAAVSFVSPGQVNAQIPPGIGTGPQQVVVTTAVGSSPAATLQLNATQPGLLAPGGFHIGTNQYVAAVLADGVTYVLPPGSVRGVPARRAKPGETITLFGVGFGPVNPAAGAGEVALGAASIVAPLQILFGQTAATVFYSGLSPGSVGLYQFNVLVPNVADSDSVPVRFTLGGAPGAQTLFTAVQR